MTQDEKRAYIEATLRKAPEGSSRRIWAEAMLRQLDGKPATEPTRDERRRTKR